MWAFLQGKKTYIVAAATVVYALAEWWAGTIDQSAAVAMILGAAGMGAIRHGISTS